MDIDIDNTLNMHRLEGCLPSLQVEYREAHPFPHVVIDNVLTPSALAAAYGDFDAVDAADWTNLFHFNSRKYTNADPETWGPTLREIHDSFSSPRFVEFLEKITGIVGLQPDPKLDGGGLHRIARDGFLNIHSDFTAHRFQKNWRRRVNLLLYLNKEWDPDWGGQLELWDPKISRCEARVVPVGNRLVIFTTDQQSFHGHPEPLTCPENVMRQSLALYYFTHEDKPVNHSTDFRARPDDGAKRFAIYVDNKAIAVYNALKRRFKFSDKAISKVLRVFSGKKGRR